MGLIEALVFLKYLAEKADEWDKLSFGNIYKPKGKKKEK
jgi:hypothetical protein